MLSSALLSEARGRKEETHVALTLEPSYCKRQTRPALRSKQQHVRPHNNKMTTWCGQRCPSLLTSLRHAPPRPGKCFQQNVVFPTATLVPSKSDLTPAATGDTGSGGGSSGGSETTQSPVFLMVALLAVVGGVLYALNRQASGGGSSTSYAAPAHSGGSRWLGGWGAGSGGGRAAGFELTDLQRRGRGDDGLGEFLVGDGRGRGDAESGPAYASLLPGQGR